MISLGFNCKFWVLLSDDGGRLPKHVAGHIYVCVCVCVCVCARLYMQLVCFLIKYNNV